MAAYKLRAHDAIHLSSAPLIDENMMQGFLCAYGDRDLLQRLPQGKACKRPPGHDRVSSHRFCGVLVRNMAACF